MANSTTGGLGNGGVLLLANSFGVPYTVRAQACLVHAHLDPVVVAGIFVRSPCCKASWPACSGPCPCYGGPGQRVLLALANSPGVPYAVHVLECLVHTHPDPDIVTGVFAVQPVLSGELAVSL